ncbi:hypothetical protein [Streptosporangium sp. NPDC048865]|uniref:hypothetical protein n=1 Tax=Streptosporangium sp. NPDC048865 TaxID=3155766 RepID=UPI003446C50D
MTESGTEPVSVSRRIPAPASRIFDILTDPARHIDLDGSGMLRGAVSPRPVSGVGDVFTMKMHYRRLGDYEMINHIVEYETNRRLAWEPEAGLGHPDSLPEGSSARWGHRWGFVLTPDGPDATIVTHTYDCSRVPEKIRKDMDNGRVWIVGMTATLERLDALSAAC